jgi:aldose 1-epimerase
VSVIFTWYSHQFDDRAPQSIPGPPHRNAASAPSGRDLALDMAATTKLVDIQGYTRRGDYVRTLQLRGPDGSTASVLTLGGRLLDLRTPAGRCLVLPLETVRDVEDDGAYVGVAVGRTANRIRGGCLRLGATVPELERNENEVNHIHGGRHGWDKRLFSVRASGVNWVSLYLFSPEGDQGYPSAVGVEVRYELRRGGELRVDLTTHNVGDAETITNMTVHPYFDLSGSGGREQGAALGWTMHAPRCGRYLPLDATNVPTGAIAAVDGTPYDFRAPRTIGRVTPACGGFDSFFLLDAHDPATAQMELLVTVEGDGARLDCWSNQPGFQLYTANGFSGEPPGGFARHGSIAIEPSAHVDAGNHSNFPSISLQPGQSKTQSIAFVFSDVLH